MRGKKKTERGKNGRWLGQRLTKALGGAVAAISGHSHHKFTQKILVQWDYLKFTGRESGHGPEMWRGTQATQGVAQFKGAIYKVPSPLEVSVGHTENSNTTF